MLGAIVGDIVGSVYEWDNIKSKDFPLFRKDCRFTDDTVMTCAVAEDGYGYDLSRTLDEIRPSYRFSATCQDSVPQAITAFLESSDFEDAIRNAISLGGDSDTIAAITGSIAEAAYGIPEWIKKKAISYLDDPLKNVLKRWRGYVGKY